MEEFISERNFARLFLDQSQLSGDYTIHKISHSLSDSDRESDITPILQCPDKKVALLSEDKIDAQMPAQSKCYHKHAKSRLAQRIGSLF